MDYSAELEFMDGVQRDVGGASFGLISFDSFDRFENKRCRITYHNPPALSGSAVIGKFAMNINY